MKEAADRGGLTLQGLREGRQLAAVRSKPQCAVPRKALCFLDGLSVSLAIEGRNAADLAVASDGVSSVIGHVMHPRLCWAGAQYSQSPINADGGAAIIDHVLLIQDLRVNQENLEAEPRGLLKPVPRASRGASPRPGPARAAFPESWRGYPNERGRQPRRPI